MELNPIGQLISTSRMGTRIPEEMLGLPARGERFDYASSTAAVESVSKVSRNASANSVQGTAQEADSTDLSVSAAAQAISSLITNNTGTADVSAFYDVLQQAIAARQVQTVSKELTSDPEYYRNLMTLSQFSSGLISDNLSTFGASGASIFNLE